MYRDEIDYEGFFKVLTIFGIALSLVMMTYNALQEKPWWIFWYINLMINVTILMRRG